MKFTFSLLILMRVHQYVKNILIFAPLFFAGNLLEINSLLKTFYAFLSFCLLASAVYIFNDYFDIEKDKNHPIKKNRPIASGKISPVLGLSVSIALTTFSLSINWLFFNSLFFLLLFYLIINILYSFKLKEVPIIDVFIVAIGFVIRLFIGESASNTELSHWIILLTFLGALFIAFAKRRDDCIFFEKDGTELRKVITGYNSKFLEGAMYVSIAVIIVSYIMYTLSEPVVSRIGNPHLYITVLFVIAGLFKYLQISLVENQAGSPTKIFLLNKPLQAIILCWLISYVYFIYY